MAYLAEALKGIAAGSGKAPGVYTYNGRADLISEITTEGYFDIDGGSGLFEVNDILYVKYNNGISFAKIICVKNDREAPQGSKLDFSVTTSFAGDVRATDAAGYQSDNFGVGMGSAQGVFMQYTYRNNTDVKATILAADYFLEAGTFLEVGDVFETVANDGIFMAMVTAASTSTVTIREIIFI